jgi:hypothetical protein
MDLAHVDRLGGIVDDLHPNCPSAVQLTGRRHFVEALPGRIGHLAEPWVAVEDHLPASHAMPLPELSPPAFGAGFFSMPGA